MVQFLSALLHCNTSDVPNALLYQKIRRYQSNLLILLQVQDRYTARRFFTTTVPEHRKSTFSKQNRLRWGPLQRIASFQNVLIRGPAVCRLSILEPWMWYGSRDVALQPKVRKDRIAASLVHKVSGRIVDSA